MLGSVQAEIESGMVIINNFHAFPPEWQASTGERGTSRQANKSKEFLQLARENPEAVVVVNCNPRLTLELGAAKLLRRLGKTPIVSVDLVLRAPRTPAQAALLAVKKLFLRQVDLYIHYFKDYRAYADVFGIPPDRHEFVPFKVNLGARSADLSEQPEGEYVLCFGRSLRDYDTFFEAMARVPYPGAVARPDMAGLQAHHARFTRPLDGLPANVRILDDDGSEPAQIRILGNARIVVLPILKASLVASGIGTCLNAMQLGKCVIGTEGPGMSDIFQDEIIAVPPEDPGALAAAIKRVWEDEALRSKTGHAGHMYALQAGGETELYQRIINQTVLWYRRKKSLPTLQ
jgi:glycosyltransferase involved in cell wall biosynthesis